MGTSDQTRKVEIQSNESPPSEPPPIVPSEVIFGDRSEIIIEHEGMRYRLRITRRGKLILQK